MTQPVVLITGASSGIGAATALLLGSKGYRVVLAARRLERLEELAGVIREKGGEALVFQVDMSQLDQIQRLVDQSLQAYGQIDILVNSAGFGKLVWLDEQSLDEIALQIQVNLVGAIQLTRSVLAGMLSRGSGQIIQIASIASWVGLPTYSIYAATKFGMRGFIESLGREVRGTGVAVSGVYPGAVDTEFDQHAGVDWKTTRVTPDWLLISAEDLAKRIYQVIIRKKTISVIPGVMLLPVWLNAHFPGFVSWVLSHYFYRKDGKTIAWRRAE